MNDNSCQKTKGNIYNFCQEAGGNIENSCQIAGRDTDNSWQETGREWYMGMIKLKKYPNTTKLIETAKDDYSLTIVEFASWCLNNPEEGKKIMGKELMEERV